MAFWCYGKNGFCDKNIECSMSCEHFDGNGGEERETLENQTDAVNDTPRWISVKDRLPEYWTPVMVYLRHIPDDGYRNIRIIMRSEEFGWVLDERTPYDDDEGHVFTDKDDFENAIVNALSDDEQYITLSEKEFDEAVKREMDKYECYWKRVIAIRASN